MRQEDIWDDEVARDYNRSDSDMFAAGVLGPTVDRLAELAGAGAGAGSGRALEFAVGTGRVAIPLAQRGVRVTGIELSEPMISQLRAKADEDAVPVIRGDMATTRVPGEFSLVYLVYNTIGNLLTQDDQVRCFQNAARHVADDGVFVLECRIPTAPARPGHQYVDPERIAADHVMLGVAFYDPLTQILDLNHVRISSDGVILSPISLRLAYPPEFDLMARIAGLRLRERWGGWNGEPYTEASWRHVSVYERAEPKK
jgi:SAM-dependent methyltransferase